jgi:hypothetical protein
MVATPAEPLIRQASRNLDYGFRRGDDIEDERESVCKLPYRDAHDLSSE